MSKIYGEVKNSAFQADMEYIGPKAKGTKRGQTLQIDLSLSVSSTTKMLSKGASIVTLMNVGYTR